jgi:hypothetical protein
VDENLVRDLILRGDDSNVNSGDRTLIKHKGNLEVAVELRE